MYNIFKKDTVRKFKNQTRGNVAMMFGIVTTVLVGGTALALDGSRLYALRANLQDITDAASLAGAYVADTDRDNRETIAREAVAFHLDSIGSTVSIEDVIIEFDDNSEEVTVRVNTQQELILAGFFGAGNGSVSADSVASYVIDDEQPVSIAFVLDVSGSMDQSASGGPARITVLKQAAVELFDAIAEDVSRPDILRGQVRTGMVAYNQDIVPEYTTPMQNGWDNSRTGDQSTLDTINSLVAQGGTNSANAFDLGLDLLEKEPAREGLRKFILFMTDGNNNEERADTETLDFCQAAKDSGVRVFTVAFEAPENGQDLLEACASLPVAENFFDADNAAELRAAFRQIGAEIGQLNTRLTQ